MKNKRGCLVIAKGQFLKSKECVVIATLKIFAKILKFLNTEGMISHWKNLKLRGLSHHLPLIWFQHLLDHQ